MLRRYWHRLRSILGTVMPKGPGADILDLLCSEASRCVISGQVSQDRG